MSDEGAYEAFITCLNVNSLAKPQKGQKLKRCPDFQSYFVFDADTFNAPWQTAWALFSQEVSDANASSRRRNKIGRFPQFYASPKEVGPTHPLRSTEAQVEIAVIGQSRKGGRPNDLHGGPDTSGSRFGPIMRGSK